MTTQNKPTVGSLYACPGPTPHGVLVQAVYFADDYWHRQKQQAGHKIVTTRSRPSRQWQYYLLDITKPILVLDVLNKHDLAYQWLWDAKLDNERHNWVVVQVEEQHVIIPEVWFQRDLDRDTILTHYQELKTV